MTTTRVFGVAALILGALSISSSVAVGRSKPHRHATHTKRVVPAPQAYSEAREPFSFYPENIEGGVRGNLPFNNQIRKFTDPLNANGAGG